MARERKRKATKPKEEEEEEEKVDVEQKQEQEEEKKVDVEQKQEQEEEKKVEETAAEAETAKGGEGKAVQVDAEEGKEKGRKRAKIAKSKEEPEYFPDQRNLV